MMIKRRGRVYYTIIMPSQLVSPRRCRHGRADGTFGPPVLGMQYVLDVAVVVVPALRRRLLIDVGASEAVRGHEGALGAQAQPAQLVDQSVYRLGGEQHSSADVHPAPLGDVSHDVMRVLAGLRPRLRSAPWKVWEGVRTGEIGVRRVDQRRTSRTRTRFVFVCAIILAASQSEVGDYARRRPHLNGLPTRNAFRRGGRWWRRAESSDQAREGGGSVPRLGRHLS
mmetsp:Transcript_31409/g.66913  ORF Transcript_31409/g.66913 Transcript_31409/m.66913 type:complete len:225 (+) Transcript_31409:294-968(+)